MRHVVGHLWREPDGRFAFAYEGDLADPKKAGFQLLTEFPDPRGRYSSPYLFSTFAQRIPSSKRPDHNEMMASWGVTNPDDQLEVLARSGGVQMTDNIELAEYRAGDDDLSKPLFFRVAGEKYYDGGERLRADDAIELRREPENANDSCATLLLVRDGTTVGYVPRQYSAMIARLLDKGRVVQARAVRRLILPEERGRWVVRIQAA
jgi:hypothetical protein